MSSIMVRRSLERGFADHGWLKSFHSFSFADYFDPRFMGFHSLRVINEDTVAPGQGFGTHGHKDMEILTYVLEGSLEHKDSMGNGSIIRPGDVQYMSAGSGVTHSEFNPDSSQLSHFVQIWIEPNIRSAPPRYDQRNFKPAQKLNKLCLIAAPETSNEQAITIRQNARLYAGVLQADHELTTQLPPGRAGYLQVLRGKLRFQNQELLAGDAVFVHAHGSSSLSGVADESEFLYFDLESAKNG